MEEWLKKFLESLGKSSIAANGPGLIASGDSTPINPSDLKTGLNVLFGNEPTAPASDGKWSELSDIYKIGRAHV